MSLLLLISSAWAGGMGPWLDDEPDQAWLSPFDAPAPEAARAAPMCTPGTLKGAVMLPNLPDLVHRYDPARSYGTQTLIDVIVGSAQQVAWLLPDADPVFVGDMSTKYGGRLGGHRQHQDGLDADIGLYTLGHQQPLAGFQDVSPSRLDVEATWYLLRAMLDTGLVDYILLDPLLIDRLRKHVATVEKLPPDELDRLFPAAGSSWPREPGFIRGAPNHRNHFHVRLRCGRPGDAPGVTEPEDDLGFDTADPFAD